MILNKRIPQTLLGKEFIFGWFDDVKCNICEKRMKKEYGIISINKSDPLRNISCYDCGILYRKFTPLEFMKHKL